MWIIYAIFACKRWNGTDNTLAVASTGSFLDFQAGFAWFNGRLAPKYGTVEARVYCQQPPGETFCSHALALGLVENLADAARLLDRFAWEDWRQLRIDAMQYGFAAKIHQQAVIPLLKEMLNIASQGLQQRGLQEEALLEPLYARLNARQSPADHLIQNIRQDGLTIALQKFSFNRLFKKTNPGIAC